VRKEEVKRGRCIEIRNPTGKVLIGIYPATFYGVDNPARLDFGVVVSDRKDGDGDEKEAREERPRVRAKGGRLRVD